MKLRFVVFCFIPAAVATGWADGGAATEYQLQTIAGSCPTGSGPALNAQTGAIKGLAADRLGNLYFSDTDNHLVRKINTNGTISTLAGTCVPGYAGDGGPASLAQLNQPYGVAVDSAGNVYVADYGNNRVRRIGLDGTISTVAGNGQAGQAGDGGTATDAPLLTPRNVAVDASGNIYISEFLGHRVRKVSPDGKIATAAGIGIAGFGGDGGPAISAQLNAPAGLAVDRVGALYIADSQNQRIRKVQGGTITTAAGPSPKLTSGGTASLFGIISVAVDSGGIIYIVEGSRVDWFNPASGLLTWQVAVPLPYDVALDASGNLFIASGTQIQKLNGSGALLKTIAGGSVGDGGNAMAAQLLQPSAVALDTAGNLHIADALNRRMRRVNSAAQIGTEAGTGTGGCDGDGGPAASATLQTPNGVAVDTGGNVLIADSGCHRIRQLSADGHIKTAVGCDHGDPNCQGLGQEGLASAKVPLSSPQGVCTDRSGVTYVVDTDNHRVLRAAPGLAVVTAAGNGSEGYSGDGYLAQVAQLHGPTACALDSAGDLFIADTGNHVIRKVTPDGMISTVAGTGSLGFGGDGGPATAAALFGPAGIVADDNGNLFISDTSNNRIRKVTPDGVIRTIAGGSGSPISNPKGLALDGSGNLYFADNANNLVRKLVPMAAASISEGAVQPTPITVSNAASQLPGPVAPGELISIGGAGLGPQVGITGVADPKTGLMPTNLGGVEVHFDGNPAPVLYAQASQLNVQVPYSISGAASTNIIVLNNGQAAGSLTVPVVGVAPAVFPAVSNQDGSMNSQSQPAPKNSIIIFYATGEGLTTGANVSGQPAAAPYAQPVGSVSVTVAGMPADILFASSAPGLVGMLQINARVPGSFVPSGQAALILTVGGASAPPVTIWLE